MAPARSSGGSEGRLLSARPDAVEMLDEYMAGGGYAAPGPEAVLERVVRARLRGRGGAGFPTAVKMAAVRDAEDRVRHAYEVIRPKLTNNGGTSLDIKRLSGGGADSPLDRYRELA